MLNLRPFFSESGHSNHQEASNAMWTDEQAIEQICEDWFGAENRKDLDAIMGFVADEVVLQAPGTPPIVGKEAMRNFMAGFLKILVSIKGGPMKIVVAKSGEIAYLYGTSTAVLRTPDDEVEDPEKYLFAWEKIDGDWKTVAASFSSDRSP